MWGFLRTIPPPVRTPRSARKHQHPATVHETDDAQELFDGRIGRRVCRREARSIVGKGKPFKSTRQGHSKVPPSLPSPRISIPVGTERDAVHRSPSLFDQHFHCQEDSYEAPPRENGASAYLSGRSWDLRLSITSSRCHPPVVNRAEKKNTAPCSDRNMRHMHTLFRECIRETREPGSRTLNNSRNGELNSHIPT